MVEQERVLLGVKGRGKVGYAVERRPPQAEKFEIRRVRSRFLQGLSQKLIPLIILIYVC